MTKHRNEFDPIEKRLRRELRQQAEHVHVSATVRERFRKMSVQVLKGPLFGKGHSPTRVGGWRGLLKRLRTFWRGTTEIPIPIASVLVAVMVTSLAVASGIGTQGDSFLWQSKSPTEETSGSYATLPLETFDSTQDEESGSDNVEIVSLPMEWIDPIW